MSGVALVTGPRSGDAGVVAAAMPDRGCVVASVSVENAGLAVTSYAWQESLSGGSFGRCGHVHVVADATLYYRDDLARRLAAARLIPRSHGSGDLIAAAVAAWGKDAPRYIEGDFAYAAFHSATREVFAARDPIGSRPLFVCRVEEGIAIASSPAALVKAGLCSDDLNAEWLAELCAGTVNVGNECAWRDITSLRQGERLRYNGPGALQVEPWYEPPPFTERGSSTVKFEDAAQELRALIVDAVRERLDPTQPTVVTLSGGRDSTAVYAAGRHCAGDRVRAVSLSYPPGNMGREDETICEVLAQCGGAPTWVEASAIPLLGHVGGAPRLHDAFRHPYEGSTRALADAASSLGARVVLNGLGGDTLFHAEKSYLADLFMTGQWRAFHREMNLQRVPINRRNVFRWGVLPRLGGRSRELIATVRGGRRVFDVWDSPVPPWTRTDPRRLAERGWQEPFRKLRKGGAGDRERRLMLLGPFAGRVVPEYTRISVARGVEQRSPLYDMRLLNFAASRPRSERQHAGDFKRLLRASMVGWLPDSVTGPRDTHTGRTGNYFLTRVVAELPQLVESYGDGLATEAAGATLAREFRVEVERLASTGTHEHLAALVFTVLTESWLRQAV